MIDATSVTGLPAPQSAAVRPGTLVESLRGGGVMFRLRGVVVGLGGRRFQSGWRESRAANAAGVHITTTLGEPAAGPDVVRAAEAALAAEGASLARAISAAGRAGRVGEAWELLERAEEEGKGVDERAYAALALAEAEGGEGGGGRGKLEVLGAMAAAGVAPGEDVFTNLLYGFVRERNVGAAWETFDYMKTTLGPVPPTALALMIEVAGMEQRVNKAFQLFDEISDTGHAPGVRAYNALLSATGSRDNTYPLAKSTFAEMAMSGVLPDAYSYNALIKAAGKAGHVDDARDAWDRMLRAGIEPSHVAYTNLVAAHASAMARGGRGDADTRSSLIRGADDVVAEFGDDPLAATAEEPARRALANAYFSVYSRSLLLNRARSLYASLFGDEPGSESRPGLSAPASLPPIPDVLLDLAPDAISHKLLVSMYVAVRRPDDAVGVVSALLDAGITPTYETLTSVSYALTKAGRLHEAVDWVVIASDLGFTPHLAHYRPLNSALNHRQDGPALAHLHSILDTRSNSAHSDSAHSDSA